MDLLPPVGLPPVVSARPSRAATTERIDRAPARISDLRTARDPSLIAAGPIARSPGRDPDRGVMTRYQDKAPGGGRGSSFDERPRWDRAVSGRPLSDRFGGADRSGWGHSPAARDARAGETGVREATIAIDRSRELAVTSRSVHGWEQGSRRGLAGGPRIGDRREPGGRTGRPRQSEQAGRRIRRRPSGHGGGLG